MALEKKLNRIGGVGLSIGKDERTIRDDKWIERVKNDDKKGFEEMYKCYYPQLGRF